MPQVPHVPHASLLSTHCSGSCNYPSFFGTILTTSLNVGAALSKTQPQSHFARTKLHVLVLRTSSFVAQFDRSIDLLSSHFNKTLFSLERCDQREIFNAPFVLLTRS